MITELNEQTDRFRTPRRVGTFDTASLLALTEASSVSELWNWLAGRLYALPIRAVAEPDYEGAFPGDGVRILRQAEAALAHRVELLGSPLSRQQWLIPAGQAYLLTGDERYAAGVRAVLEDWIAGNPYGQGVDWACTREASMRTLAWTWFFHVFARTRSWSDGEFQSRFLRTLFLHGELTEHYLERAEINGNHFTAGAVAMLFAGLFFGRGAVPARWSEDSWRHLSEELPRQVLPDGLDFEASIPYHGLMLELFFLAARYREACGLPVSDAFRDRLVNMARFTLVYTRPDGSTPLLGHAQDARALPFSAHAIGDHRCLVGLVGAHWSVPELIDGFRGSRAEIFWTLGARAAALLREVGGALPIRTMAFPREDIFVMRNRRDHVCIDPVGLARPGGDGHND